MGGMSQVELTFRSELSAPRDRVWAWVTSMEGISRELWPILRMTAPRGVKSIGDVPIEPGNPLFRSWILLFGIIPIDRSDLTLLSLDVGKRFVEQSPMLSMSLWRHVRTLSSTPKAGGFTAAAASADRAMRAGRVPHMPRWLRQPRHGSRAWNCPFTLASGFDPRHESRVAFLAREELPDEPCDFRGMLLVEEQ